MKEGDIKIGDPYKNGIIVDISTCHCCPDNPQILTVWYVMANGELKMDSPEIADNTVCGIETGLLT